MTSPQKQLWKLVQKGDLDNLSLYLQSMNNEDEKIFCVKTRHKASGDSIIHLAARYGHLHILKYLTEMGIGLELRNLDNKTPLHIAAAACHVNVVQYLIEKHVALDCLKKSDWSPLMLACTKQGNIQVVQMLIEEGANIKLMNKDGWDCFHLACREGDIDIMRYILSIDPLIWNTVSNNGRSPLHTAALHGKYKAVEMLIKYRNYKIDIQDSCGSTPLMDAIRGGNFPTIKLFLGHNADVCIEDKLGRNALHVAAECNEIEAIKLLIIEYNMDPNCLTLTKSNSRNGHSPLQYAYKENQWAAVKVLKEFGAS